MSTRFMTSRRSVLAGGASLALVGCEPSNNVGGGSEGAGSLSGETINLPSWAEIGIFLSMTSIAGPIGGILAGAIRLPRLANALRKVGEIADLASLIPDAIQGYNQLRAGRFALSTQASAPRPFVVPENGNINNFESVPVFKNDVTLQFGILNEEGGNFGDHDIYATVKRLNDRPPQTLNEVWGTGELPHAIISPASNGSYDGKLDIGILPVGAFISYSWQVPRGQQPTDEFITSSAFIGPAFLSISDNGYSDEFAENLDIGTNVEARFQLPSADFG